jgi:hypothetical protein
MKKNNHEKEAIEFGYIDKFFSNYLVFRDNLWNKIEDTKTNLYSKNYYNALRIYAYTIFENLWFGYLLSYSDYHYSYFKIGDKMPIKYDYPYRKHLPSFSSIILHFGTCRDLYFILLKIYLIEKKQLKQNNFYPVIKMGNCYRDFDKFKCDIKKLNGKDNSVLIEKGEMVFNNNLLRNIYAHKMRLPW